MLIAAQQRKPVQLTVMSAPDPIIILVIVGAAFEALAYWMTWITLRVDGSTMTRCSFTTA